MTIDVPQIGPIDVAETKYAYFPFTAELGAATIVSVLVTVELVAGTDATPGDILVGVPLVDNVSRLVAQLVAAPGRAGNSYKLRCVATDNLNHQHTIAVMLPVVRL